MRRNKTNQQKKNTKRNANTELTVVFCSVLLDDSFFHIYPADSSSTNEAEINVVTYFKAWFFY